MITQFINNSVCLAVTSLLILTGCYLLDSPSSKFQERVGKETFAILSKPNHVKIEGQRSLTDREVEELNALLLQDKGYIFDRTKKCLFIPEVTFTFEKKGKVVVIVSLICKQIKVVNGDKSIILDTDPMEEELEDFMNTKMIDLPVESSLQSEGL